jgi:peptidoglycan/xylan/chitin deacetylase (PgdA/CDA1 family)
MIGIVVTTAGIGIATGLGYNAMAPRSQLFGRTFIGNGCNDRRLALTFDDGPNDPHTTNLLEVLDRHGVKATFFMIGRYVRERPEIAAAVARAGHVIGNHTFTHPNLIFCSRAQIRAQLESCEHALTDVVGEHSRLFRPPFGGRRPAVFEVATELGFSVIMWSVTSHDWRSDPATRVEAQVLRQVRGGDLILLHDGGHRSLGADRSQTVKATDAIIRRYHDQGFTFVAVPEMMEGKEARSPKLEVRSQG